MLTLLLHQTPLVFSNLNNSSNMMQEITPIIKDIKVTTTPLILCITQVTTAFSKITISSKLHYSRILLNIKDCSKLLADPQEEGMQSTKKEEGEEVTINSELSHLLLNTAFD